MESLNPVRGIADDTDVAKITIISIPDKPGIAYQIFHALAKANINVDVIVQNVSDKGITDLSFTTALSDLEKAQAALEPVVREIGAKGMKTSADLAKVSIVGNGIRSHPGYADTMFGALAKEGINIVSISTSEIRITCLIDKSNAKKAVEVLHKAFHLETPSEDIAAPIA